MADFLAIDWDTRKLCGMEAQVGKGTVRIRKAFALEWPTIIGSQAETESQRADWLKTELKRLNISTAPVLVCLPRESAVVRQLEVPDVADYELPDIVRLQAETKMSTSIDMQLLDFLPLPKRDDTATREVLLATVPKDAAAGISRVLNSAGLEVKSIGLSSAATTELVARAETRRGFDPDEACLVLARHNRRLEISVVRQKHLLFTHSAELAGESEERDVQTILAEVSRSFISIERQLRGAKVARAWVVGSGVANEPLCRALEDRLARPVHLLQPVSDMQIPFSPTDIDGDEAHYAGPVGMLLSQSGKQADSIDFLNPRKAGKRIDEKTKRIRIAAIAAAAVILIGSTLAFMKNQSLTTELAEKQKEKSQLENAKRASEPAIASAGVVQEWVDHDIVWPDELRKLKQALPGTDRIFMTNFTFITAQNPGKEIGTIKATGYAIERYDVEQLEQQLSNLGYVVHTKPTKRSQKDPKYVFRFDLDLRVKDPKVLAKEQADKEKAKKKTGQRSARKA